MNAMNGGRLVYWLLGAMLAVTLAASTTTYSLNSRANDILARRVEEIHGEQMRRGGRIAAVETRQQVADRDFVELKQQLTRIEAELIAVRLLVAQRLK